MYNHFLERKLAIFLLCALISASFLVFSAPDSHAQTIADGDLIRAEGTFDIYIVKLVGTKKFKRLILNPAIFESYGHLRWDSVKDVSQAVVEDYVVSNLVIEVNADGSVADPKVYVINSVENGDVGERRHLDIEAEEFETSGLDWDAIYKVNHTEASPSFYPTKTRLTPADNVYKWATTIKGGLGATQVPDNAEEEDSAFTLTSVNPDKILTNVVSKITIAGENIDPGATVTINDIVLGSGAVVSGTTLSINIPNGILQPGTYSVVVANSSGEVRTLTDALTVVAPPPPLTTELTTQEVTALVAPAVVQIKNDGCTSNGYCLGSGVIIDASGSILTNQHVVAGDTIVEVKLHDGQIVSGTVKGWDEVKDLAVVKINPGNSYALFGDSGTVSLGGKAVALGYPLPVGFPGSMTVSEGIFSSKGKTDKYGVAYLQTSAPIQSGSSGGPLVNMQGEIVGINTLCTQLFNLCVEDLRYAVEINQAKKILSDLKAGLRVGFPDTTQPIITNVQASVTDSSATITWTTDEPTTSRIDYGLTSSLGSSSIISSLKTSHSVVLTGLNSSTQYYYRITSTDASGNETKSAIKTFTTTGVPTLSVAFQAVPYTTLVTNTSSAVISKVKLVAGNGGDVRVTRVKFSADDVTGLNTTSAANTNFNSLKLWDASAGAQVGNTLSAFTDGTPDTANFTGLSITVPKNGQVVLELRASVLGSSGSYFVGIADIDADVTSTGLASNTDITESGTDAGDSGEITLSAAGTLTVSVDPSTVTTGQVAVGTTAGATGVEWGSIKLTATAEDIQLTRLKLTLAQATGGTTTDEVPGFAGVSLYLGSTRVSGPLAPTGTNAGGDVTMDFGFTAGSVVVPKNSSLTLTIKADLNGTSTGATAGESPTFHVADVTGAANLVDSDIEAKGATSGSIVTSFAGTLTPETASNFNAQTIHKTTLSVALNSASPSGTATRSSNQTILSLDFDAASQASVEIDKITIALASNGGLQDGAALFLKDGATTVATGYYSGTTFAGSVTFIPTSQFTIPTTGKTLTLVADTTTLITAVSKTLAMTMDLGSSDSMGNVTEGDVWWRDGELVDPIKWVDSSSPVASGTLSY